MADLKVTLTLKAVDRMTAPLRKIVQTVQRLTGGFARVGSGARRAAGGILKLARSFAEASKGFRLAADLRQAGEAVSLVGQKLRGMLAAPIATSEEFAAKMTEVRAIMRMTAADPAFAMLTKEAERLGFEKGEFTMQDAAEGMRIMAMAGREADDMMKALPVTLNLSTAAGMDFAETTDTLLGIMGAFKLEAADTANVADVLTATFTGSKLDLQKLSETFKYSQAVAAKAGVTYKELALMTGLLGNTSIDSTVAGTALNQMMLKLIKPGDAAIAFFEKYKISIEDANSATGAMRPSVEILRDIGRAMEGMTDVKKAKVLSEIFGIRGFKGAAGVIGALGSKDFEKLNKAINESTGLTKEIADEFRKTAKNETLQMRSAIDSLGKVLGDTLAPQLKWLKALVKDTATAIAGWTREHPTLTKMVMITVGALALLFTALAGLLFMIAAVSSLVALVMAPAFIAAAVAVWAFLAPMLLSIGAVALFVIGINLLIAAIALMIIHKDRVRGALVGFFEALGLWPAAAERAASAVMVLIETLLGPLYAVSNAVNDIITNWDKMAALGRGIGRVALPGLFAAGPGPEAPAAEAGGAGTQNVGGELKISIDAEGRPVVKELSAEGALDFAVDVGRSVLGL